MIEGLLEINEALRLYKEILSLTTSKEMEDKLNIRIKTLEWVIETLKE